MEDMTACFNSGLICFTYCKPSCQGHLRWKNSAMFCCKLGTTVAANYSSYTYHRPCTDVACWESPVLQWEATPLYLSPCYWRGNTCLIWCSPGLHWLFIYLFIYLLLQFCTWSSQIELFLPPVLSAEGLTAPEMSREKLDGQQTDTQTVDSIKLLRRSPSQIVQIVHM